MKGEIKMKCPKCGSKEVVIKEGYVMPDAMDADLYCNECDDVVAFHRIKNEDWIDRE